MIALLGTLFLGLIVGKNVRRLGLAVDLVLLLVIGGLVALEFMSWSGRGGGGTRELLRGLMSLTR
jgi:hypothetical protein